MLAVSDKQIKVMNAIYQIKRFFFQFMYVATSVTKHMGEMWQLP